MRYVLLLKKNTIYIYIHVNIRHVLGGVYLNRLPLITFKNLWLYWCPITVTWAYKHEPLDRLFCFISYSIKHGGYWCWDHISYRLRFSLPLVFWKQTHVLFSIILLDILTLISIFNRSINQVLSRFISDELTHAPTQSPKPNCLACEFVGCTWVVT